MTLAWLILLQGTSPAAEAPLRLDILDVSPATRCADTADAEDIVVCGRRDANEQYRIRSLPGPEQELLVPKAEIGVGNARLSAEAEQAAMPTGEISKRAMIRLKLPF